MRGLYAHHRRQKSAGRHKRSSESYEAVEKLFAKLNMKTEQISEGSTAFFIKDYKKMAEEIGVGEITLRDIIKELQKPGRDRVTRCRARSCAPTCSI